jgi:hypothetical protein
MGSDYVTVDNDNDDDIYKQKYDGDDFPSMFVKLCSRINLKIGIFIFLIGLFIFSDVFVNTILSMFKGAISNIQLPTTYGTVIQLIFLVIAYLIIDLLVQAKYI